MEHTLYRLLMKNPFLQKKIRGSIRKNKNEQLDFNFSFKFDGVYQFMDFIVVHAITGSYHEYSWRGMKKKPYLFIVGVNDDRRGKHEHTDEIGATLKEAVDNLKKKIREKKYDTALDSQWRKAVRILSRIDTDIEEPAHDWWEHKRFKVGMHLSLGLRKETTEKKEGYDEGKVLCLSREFGEGAKATEFTSGDILKVTKKNVFIQAYHPWFHAWVPWKKIEMLADQNLLSESIWKVDSEENR